MDRARRRQATVAGHTGDVDTARALLHDHLPEVRAAALTALVRSDAATIDDIAGALTDPVAAVRIRACELAMTWSSPDLDARMRERLTDDDPSVAETAAWALGERGDREAVPALAHMATAHDDALCREAAVAALGAIGDSRGLPAVLAACRDKPAIRRRAVLALAPFDGAEVEDALARARTDRDWQVRQAAEDLLGARGPQ